MNVLPNRILHINLSDEDYTFIDARELFDKWLGGVGVGINLLNQHVNADTDPLSEENAIIFAIGALTTFYPIISNSIIENFLERKGSLLSDQNTFQG